MECQHKFIFFLKLLISKQNTFNRINKKNTYSLDGNIYYFTKQPTDKKKIEIKEKNIYFPKE